MGIIRLSLRKEISPLYGRNNKQIELKRDEDRKRHEKLKKMSAVAIDRKKRYYKKQLELKRGSKTKPGSLLKS